MLNNKVRHTATSGGTYWSDRGLVQALFQYALPCVGMLGITQDSSVYTITTAGQYIGTN